MWVSAWASKFISTVCLALNPNSKGKMPPPNVGSVSLVGGWGSRLKIKKVRTPEWKSLICTVISQPQNSPHLPHSKTQLSPAGWATAPLPNCYCDTLENAKDQTVNGQTGQAREQLSVISGSTGNNKVTEGTGRKPTSKFQGKRELRPRKNMVLNTKFASLRTSATLLFTI